MREDCQGPQSQRAERTTHALEGWRVAELADGVAAAFCGKILADLGAEVVKIEPPEGHPSRGSGHAHARFTYLNTGKSSLLVDSTGDGQARLHRLIADADLLITDRDPSGLEAIAELPADVAWVSIRPFGLTGPYAQYRAHHLITFHSGSEGSILPSGPGWTQFPNRAPIQLGSDIGEFDSGWNAAVAALAALYQLRRSGRAQHIDVSEQESQLTLNRTRLSRFNNDGIVLRREANRYGIAGMMRCRDGWVQLVGVRDEHWERLIASPDGTEFADDRFATAAARAENLAALGDTLASWCAARSKSEVVNILGTIGCAVGAYAVASDLLSSAQLAHREFFQDIDDGCGGRITLPGAPYKLSRTPVKVRPAPELGSTHGFQSRRAQRTTGDGGRYRLLEGIRVLDFTWAAAGPYATLLLAMLGAEVIKVETARRPDPARRGFLTDYSGTNRSPNFNELNLNKRGLQLDLTQPEGIDIAHRLSAQADVVVNNFRPGVMERLGLGAETLLAAHPKLIVASSSANGSTGPEAMAAGLASIFGATGGLSEQTGYEDGPPTEVGESTDYRSANAFVVGVLAALLHREATGEGQHVDLASREVVVATAPDAVLAHVLGMRWQPRLGNRHRQMAPHDVYRCTGDDQWIAIAIANQQEWSALCTVLGHQDWANCFPTAAERHAAISVIDPVIATWTAQRSPEDAFTLLQRAGVPAMPVMTNAALASDPHLAARGVFIDVEHPEIGKQRVMRAPWLFSDAPNQIRRSGPLLGQDNRYVLEEVLGMAPDWQTTLARVLQ